jgi:hypothetical protein
MDITVNGWTTNIKAYKRRMKRFKLFFSSRKGIVYVQVTIHAANLKIENRFFGDIERFYFNSRSVLTGK